MVTLGDFSEAVCSLQEKGFAILPAFVPEEQVEAMKKRAREIASASNPEKLSIFQTSNEQQRTSDEYFLTSGDKVRCFFEQEAVQEGQLALEREVCVNKIGHALHVHDETFKQFSTSANIRALVKALGFEEPLLVQSMFIFKNPQVGGEVSPHQDSTFLWTDPKPTCIGLWFALDDASIENGCLWAIPGSHTTEITRRFVRTPSGNATEWRGCSSETVCLDDFTPLEVEKGTLVVLHGGVMHMSYANKSKRPRNAFTLHIIEGKDTIWPKENWLQSATPFVAL